MINNKLFLTVSFLSIIIILSVTVYAARLPTVGGDNDTWGTVLNNYLNISLNGSGELRDNTVSTLQIVSGTLTDDDISDTTNLTLGEKITFALGEIIDNIVNGWITITGSLNVTQNLNVVGNATIDWNLNVTGNISANWIEGKIYWSDVQNAPDFIENNTEGWNLTFINIKSNNWNNITITESQIDDLQSYVSNSSNIAVLDINASSATINGNLNVTGTSYLGDITITSDNITVNGVLSKDGNISFYNISGSENFKITNGGKIGLGTTNPNNFTKLHIFAGNGAYDPDNDNGYNLEIEDNANSYIHMNPGLGSWGGFLVGKNSENAEWDGSLIYKPSTMQMKIITNGSDRIIIDENFSFYKNAPTGAPIFRIISSGNVGIGINSPSEKLNVSGNIGASGNLTATYFFGNGSQLTSLTESQIDDLVHSVNNTNLAVLDINASSATINGNLNVTGTSYLGDITITSDNITVNGVLSKDGNISFYNISGSENFKITNGGKAGIGSNRPLATLHLQGPDIDTPDSELSNILSFYVGNGSGAAVGIGYNSSSHSYIQSYGNKPLIINGAGNSLGIGAVSVPFGPMHLILPNNAIGLYLENSGGTTNKREFSIYGDSQTLAIGAYNDVGTFIRSLILFDHDGSITLPSLASVTDVRSVCATAAGELELKDGACSGSSRRFKENEKSLSYGINELMLLKPKFFNYKTHSNVTNDLDYLGSRTKRRMGLIAEDVFEVLPEVVVVEDGIIDSVDYSNLIPLTIKAIQEQQLHIEELIAEGNLSSNVNTPSKKLRTLTVTDKTSLFDVFIDGATEIKEAIFTGQVTFSKDSVGQAMISAGDTEVQVNFDTTYKNSPIVTLTPLEFVNGQYKLSEKTLHGFKIVLQNVQSQDISFDWHAFDGDGVIIPTISEDLTSIVVNSDKSTIISETDIKNNSGIEEANKILIPDNESEFG